MKKTALIITAGLLTALTITACSPAPEKTTGEKIGEKIDNAIEWGKPKLDNLTEKMGPAVEDFIEWGKPIVKEVGDTLKPAAKKFINDVGPIVTDTIEKSWEFIKENLDNYSQNN